MDIEEHLLVTLAEECSEIQKSVSKALRFGLDDPWRDGEFSCSPREMIQKELSDLIGVAEMLAQTGTLSWPIADGDLVEAKKLKVRKFFGYARKQGRLQD